MIRQTYRNMCVLFWKLKPTQRKIAAVFQSQFQTQRSLPENLQRNPSASDKKPQNNVLTHSNCAVWLRNSSAIHLRDTMRLQVVQHHMPMPNIGLTSTFTTNAAESVIWLFLSRLPSTISNVLLEILSQNEWWMSNTHDIQMKLQKFTLWTKFVSTQSSKRNDNDAKLH